MCFSKQLDFSNQYAPPKTDLRHAQILDDWGDESYSTMTIDHKSADDVTIEELNFYPQTFTFMDPESVLFYAYSVIKYHNHPDGNDYWPAGVDNYFSFIDSHLNDYENYSIDVLMEFTKKTWQEKPFFFWLYNCPNLQKKLNLYVTFDDYLNQYR